MDALPSLGTFDFVVVGAGPSAAGLLKGLLTPTTTTATDQTCNEERRSDTTSTDKTNGDYTVAVIEQGGDESPNREMDHWASDSQNVVTVPRLLATIHGNRVFPIPLARGLGGLTRVNAGLVIPPSPTDFDSAPYTNRNEAMEAIGTILQSLPVQHSSPPMAARRSGFLSSPSHGLRDDENHDDMVGTDETTPTTVPRVWNVMTYPSVCTNVPCCVDENGRRVTYYEALVPNDAENLTLFLHYKVERIVLIKDDDVQQSQPNQKQPNQKQQQQQQRQIQHQQRNQNHLIVRNVITDRLYRIDASREIILCAGTMETPALLIASGLMGRASPIVDHHVLPKIYIHWPRWNNDKNINNNDNDNKTNERKCWPTNGVSGLSQFITEQTNARIQVGLHEGSALIDLIPYLIATITWFRAYPGDTIHQILLRFVQLLVHRTPLYYLFRYCVTVMTIFLMNPYSHGTVSLVPKQQPQHHHSSTNNNKSNNILLYRSDYNIHVELQYLSDERDYDKFAEAWKHPCFFAIDDGIEIFPSFYSRTFAKLFVLPYFHWMGTCSQSIDQDYRISKVPSALRVCDASILPGLSAPTSLTCAALGYILGNRLRKEASISSSLSSSSTK